MGARPLPAGLVALAVALAGPAAAVAKDPGRWRLVRSAEIPLGYNQGVAAVPGRSFVFNGTTGLFATSPALRERAAVLIAIPEEVRAAEGYDHIGDIAYDRAEGGRLLLPLECFRPGGPNSGNHCGTGSIGVASPRTLAWRYHVRLDPRDIAKAMWVAVEPGGRALWTQAGDDLLRYDLRGVTRANAAPTGRPLRPVRRLRGAVRGGQVTGATFVGRRLFVARQGGRRMQVHSIGLRTGRRRLEIARAIRGESEGLVNLRARGGRLHWTIAPFDPQGREPTYSARDRCAVLTFAPRRR